MALKAVLFDFNGTIINDEPIHQELIEQILIAENLLPHPGEYRQFCLGRSDRASLKALLENRGRFVSETSLNDLINRKVTAYQEKLATLEKLPIYPGIDDLIYKIRLAKLKIALVTGALRSEVEIVLNRTDLVPHFSVIVTGDDIETSKPDPDGYLLAIERLNQLYPDLKLHPCECLAIEDTPVGIAAAKKAGLQVVGVANTYPFHMLQRQANWVVDYLWDLDMEWVQQVFSQVAPLPITSEC